MAMQDTSWQERALCPEVDNDMFFPEQGGELADEAKAVCNLCEVKDECLMWALEVGFPIGIFGGTSPKTRTRMRPRYAKMYGWAPLPKGASTDGKSQVDQYLEPRQRVVV